MDSYYQPNAEECGKDSIGVSCFVQLMFLWRMLTIYSVDDDGRGTGSLGVDLLR